MTHVLASGHTTVEPEDWLSPEAGATIIAILVGLALLAFVLYFFGSSVRLLFSGGLRRWRHEWVSGAGDCDEGGCWRRVRYRVTLPSVGERTYDRYWCQQHVGQAGSHPVHYLSDEEVRAHEKEARARARAARIKHQEAQERIHRSR
jgi:hypothetical protein